MRTLNSSLVSTVLALSRGWRAAAVSFVAAQALRQAQLRRQEAARRRRSADGSSRRGACRLRQPCWRRPRRSATGSSECLCGHFRACRLRRPRRRRRLSPVGAVSASTCRPACVNTRGDLLADKQNGVRHMRHVRDYGPPGQLLPP